MPKRKRKGNRSPKRDSTPVSHEENVVEFVTEDVQNEFVDYEPVLDDDNTLEQRLEEHNETAPVLSGGDVDAQWERSDIGEESVGGSTPTPDQDVVDELGSAVGFRYQDNEPLHTEDKLRERDEARWELDVRSREDELNEDVEKMLDEKS